MRRSFDSIRLRQKSLLNQLNQLSAIFTHVSRAKIATAFARIASVKPVIAKVESSPAKQQRSRVPSKVE